MPAERALVVANFIINDYRGMLRKHGKLPLLTVEPSTVGTLAWMVATGRITKRHMRNVVEEIVVARAH